MNSQQYQDLTPEQRRLIWSQLQQHPAWLLLKSEVISELAASPDIRDCDSKEAFLYQSIKAKELLKFLNTPEDRIALIDELNGPKGLF